MKKIIIILVVSLICALSLSAQEVAPTKFRLHSLSLSSGKGIISSGLIFKTDLSYGQDLVNIKISQDDMYVLYLKRLNARIYSGPSIEFFHNIPTLGLMTSVNFINTGKFSLGTTNWFAFSAGDLGEKAKLTDWNFLFFYESLDLKYDNLSLSAAALWYKTWIYAAELKYKLNLTPQIGLIPSLGYNFSQKDYLFGLGITYKF